MTYFRRIRGNIVLAVEKYWTRLRLVQYFSTARTIFPRIRLKAIQYYVIIIHMRHFRGKIKTRILLALLSLV